jgi:hypothetical protein
MAVSTMGNTDSPMDRERRTRLKSLTVDCRNFLLPIEGVSRQSSNHYLNANPHIGGSSYGYMGVEH